MKNIKTYILLGILVLAGVSCSEEFLEKKPYNSVPTDEAFQTLEDFEIALNGVYAGFKASNSYGSEMMILTDIMTDLVLAVNGYSNTYGEMYKYSFHSGTGEPESHWAGNYKTISGANNILERLDSLDAETIAKDDIKGQALFARALGHFNLTRLYAAPYNIETSEELGVPYLKKSEFGEPEREILLTVYENIIEDVTNAKNLIANEGAPNDFYFSKNLCDAFLARVYLNMEQWDSAIYYSTKIIADSVYTLSDSASFYNLWKKDESTELIWRVAFTPTDVGGTPGARFVNDAQGLPMPDYIPANWLLDMYDRLNDVRYYAYYRHNSATEYGWSGSLMNKYPTNELFTDNGANMPKPFRLAEMYLIAAEAYAERGGSDAEARDYLNALRAKRISNYIPVTSLGGGALKNAIFEERTKELCFEGHYWYDLKRKGKGFKRVPQENTLVANDLEIKADDHRWRWPIPQSELNGNDYITPNDGY